MSPLAQTMTSRELLEAAKQRALAEARAEADALDDEGDDEGDDEPESWAERFMAALQRQGFAVQESTRGPQGSIGVQGPQGMTGEAAPGRPGMVPVLT